MPSICSCNMLPYIVIVTIQCRTLKLSLQTEQFALPAVEPQSFRDRGTSPRRSNRMYDSYDSSQMTPPGSSSGRMMVPHNNYYQRIGSPRKSEGYQSYPDGQEYVNKVYRFSGNPRYVLLCTTTSHFTHSLFCFKHI